ncbi:unnamed protein product [Pedinophyceae sp. YPF-701]|nr:unnamed protein product [Pedinophyceae sp. YPF-701]
MYGLAASSDASRMVCGRHAAVGSKHSSLCPIMPRRGVWRAASPSGTRVNMRVMAVGRGDRRAVRGRFGDSTPGRESEWTLPTQADMVTKGGQKAAVAEVKEKDDALDYLSELRAIQDNDPKKIGFFGTRNLGLMHQKLVETLAYAMIITGNKLVTSGATGTNAAVIRGALRAPEDEVAENLLVVLPQSSYLQPAESRELLEQVRDAGCKVIESPENDGLSLYQASQICNRDIVNRVEQVIIFAFHDSSLLLSTASEARARKRLVTLFYLD